MPSYKLTIETGILYMFIDNSSNVYLQSQKDTWNKNEEGVTGKEN